MVDAHDPSKKHRPMMTTADLSLRFDPIYEPIAVALPAEPRGIRGCLRPGVVQADPSCMGPRSRYLGPEVPAEELIGKTRCPQSIIS